MRGQGDEREGRVSGERCAVDELSEEERDIVAVVRDFVDGEVRPVVRDLEHAGSYPGS